MSMLQAQRGLTDIVARLGYREAAGEADIFPQVSAGDIFHRIVNGIAHLIRIAELHDVRMIEAGHRIHFQEKLAATFIVGDDLGLNQFQGDDPLVLAMASLIDGGKTTLAETIEDVIRTDDQLIDFADKELVDLKDREPAALDKELGE